ncbi:unnamed protein product [Rotaria magnacalcarata]|uniref:VCBS repeat-containing protein n=1 Tax=Rotaria magnacalcarata TaxID=392030 RepID=A0A8S2REP2_9BILA|nr:unnamed protein product [Rotaria magnacalcarata]
MLLIGHRNGDFNNDNCLDLVIANQGTDEIGISLGFNYPTFLIKKDSTPASVTNNDLNNANILDLVVVDMKAMNILVFIGKENGLFADSMVYRTGIGSSPISAKIGDFNNDFHLDIAVAHSKNDSIGILYGYGNGTFADRIIYSTGSNSAPISVTVGSINRDDYSDMVVALSGTNQLAIFMGYNNGVSDWPQCHSVGSGKGPVSACIDEFNVNYRTDIILVNQVSEVVTILFDYDNESFSKIKVFKPVTGSLPTTVSIDGLNNDGYLDMTVILTGINSVALLFDYDNGNFTESMVWSTGDGSCPTNVALGDVNSDNLIDIVTANYQTDSVEVLCQDKRQMFLNQITYSTGTNSYPRSVIVADFNSDDHKGGKTDFFDLNLKKIKEIRKNQKNQENPNDLMKIELYSHPFKPKCKKCDKIHLWKKYYTDMNMLVILTLREIWNFKGSKQLPVYLEQETE